MPSYPIRPTFPIDVRSTPSITASREGTAFRFDLNSAGVLNALGPSPSQFFAALEAVSPGSTAILNAAVPADPSDPINRAFNGTTFVAAAGVLAGFAKATLGLSDAQIGDILKRAVLQPT